jgi:hypothetical protein
MTMVEGLRRSWDKNDERGRDKARAAYVEDCGEALTLKREAEIAAMPQVEWKGRKLRTIRCHGTTGKGPHDVNVPESLLWALISLKRFRCPYHN